MKILMPAEVTAIRDLTPRIRLFTLRPRKRPAFPPFRGGAHTILQLRPGLRRPYSITSDPARPESWEVAVLREPEGRGGSLWLHEEAVVGSPIAASFPQQNFALAEGATRHILIAGGIGITPFLSMLAEAPGAELHYCARAPEDAAFLPELRALLGPRLVTWFASEGRRLDLPALLAIHAPGTHAYACGPARLLEAFSAATAHWPAGHAHLEHFAGLTPGAAGEGTAFEAEIASTGEVITVPAGVTLLAALRAAGQRVDSACEGGVCGACAVPLEGGEAEHRDMCLKPGERAGQIVTCVSRGKGRLRLGL